MSVFFLLAASFFVIMYAWTAFILPLILGSILLIKFRHDELSRALGWLTLKPIPATFLLAWCFALLGGTGIDGNNIIISDFFLSLGVVLPGVVLTLLISFRFRQLFKTQTRIFSIMLVLDAIRWINTFLMMSPWTNSSFRIDDPQGPFYIFALILPNVYALIAISIGIFRARKGNIPTPISFT